MKEETSGLEIIIDLFAKVALDIVRKKHPNLDDEKDLLLHLFYLLYRANKVFIDTQNEVDRLPNAPTESISCSQD